MAEESRQNLAVYFILQVSPALGGAGFCLNLKTMAQQVAGIETA